MSNGWYTCTESVQKAGAGTVLTCSSSPGTVHPHASRTSFARLAEIIELYFDVKVLLLLRWTWLHGLSLEWVALMTFPCLVNNVFTMFFCLIILPEYTLTFVLVIEQNYVQRKMGFRIWIALRKSTIMQRKLYKIMSTSFFSGCDRVTLSLSPKWRSCHNPSGSLISNWRLALKRFYQARKSFIKVLVWIEALARDSQLWRPAAAVFWLFCACCNKSLLRNSFTRE